MFDGKVDILPARDRFTNGCHFFFSIITRAHIIF